MRAFVPARTSSRSLVAALGVAGVVLAGGGVAQAQDGGGPSCRASAARVVVGAAAVAEPAVANGPSSPCATQHQELAGVQPAGPLSVSTPQATTRRATGVAAASSSVAGVSLGGVVPISVGAVRSTQVQSCQNGRSVASGDSSVDALVVAGIPVSIVGGQAIDQTIAGVRIRTNQVAGGTRQALVLDVAGTQVVLGEATAAGDGCSTSGTSGGGGGAGGTGTGPTTGPGQGDSSSRRICAEGSTYRVSEDVCVIEVMGPNGAVARTIIVGEPYTGPIGGTVIALTEAQRLAAAGKLEKSACLRGKGPAYVVIGDAGRDDITGTNGRDRILGRAGNDSVSGGRGDDCIDGNAGSDHLSGSDGADALYGAAGNDKVNGDSGSDRLSGGVGNDTFNTAYGRDKVFGGPGRDAINAATSGPPATISGGPGRDTVRINTNERRHVKGAERVFTIR